MHCSREKVVLVTEEKAVSASIQKAVTCFRSDQPGNRRAQQRVSSRLTSQLKRSTKGTSRGSRSSSNAVIVHRQPPALLLPEFSCRFDTDSTKLASTND